MWTLDSIWNVEINCFLWPYNGKEMYCRFVISTWASLNFVNAGFAIFISVIPTRSVYLPSTMFFCKVSYFKSLSSSKSCLKTTKRPFSQFNIDLMFSRDAFIICGKFYALLILKMTWNNLSILLKSNMVTWPLSTIPLPVFDPLLLFSSEVGWLPLFFCWEAARFRFLVLYVDMKSFLSFSERTVLTLIFDYVWFVFAPL